MHNEITNLLQVHFESHLFEGMRVTWGECKEFAGTITADNEDGTYDVYSCGHTFKIDREELERI